MFVVGLSKYFPFVSERSSDDFRNIKLSIYLQFRGFSEIVANGYYFTGSESTITTSFIYLVVLLHIAHVIAGLICLVVVIYNHYKQKYSEGKTLGIELAATFWHFVDILWIYLLLFFYFVR